MTLISVIGAFTIFLYIAAYLFIIGGLFYGLLTFWKFIVTMIMYGALVSLLIVGLVLLL